MRKILTGALALAVLSGCAGTGTHWQPVVDIRSDRQQAMYQGDLAQCQAYASQVMSAGEGAAAGAVAGALLGVLLGAVAGGNGRFNGRMAGVGAVSGAAGSAGAAEGGQRGIISRCLAGRGYVTLN